MEGILPICNLNEIMINNGIQGSHSWDKPIYCDPKGSRSFLVLWGPWWMDVKGCWFWQITVTQWSSLHYVWLNWLNILNLKCSVIYILNSVVTVKSSDKWFSSAGWDSNHPWVMADHRQINPHSLDEDMMQSDSASWTSVPKGCITIKLYCQIFFVEVTVSPIL